MDIRFAPAKLEAENGSPSNGEDGLSASEEALLDERDVESSTVLDHSNSAKDNSSEGLSNLDRLAVLDELLPNPKKAGIVYLSRVPPFMKPDKVRHLLSAYGDIGKVFLSPEDPKITARRRKYKNQKRPHYTEGWVEFLDKKDAKAVAKMLNAKSIGGAGRSRYKEDLWNLKYLQGFKWTQLTEQIAYEKAVRDQKLRVEMQQAKKENELYLKQVAKSKMIKSILERKEAKSLEES